VAAAAALGGGVFAFRDRIWPAPLLARLAMLPLSGSTGDKAVDERLRGALTEIAARLESIGAESRRLLLILPEESARHLADTVEAAKGRLGATHSFSVSVQGKPAGVAVRAEIRATDSGDLIKGFDAEFRLEELAALSTSLAGVVTLAFQLGKTLETSVNKEAYPFYAGALGLLARDRVSYDRALALLDTAAELDRQSGLIQAARTTAYLQKFRSTKDDQWLKPAAEAAANAGRLHPDDPLVLIAMGELDSDEGRTDLAIERYQRAAALEPNRSKTWQVMGLALQRMGKQQEAVASLRKAIALAPGYYAPHVSLASVYFQNGRFTDAINEQRIATELAPKQPAAFLNYGALLLVAERDAEAETAFRRCQELQDPRAPINMNNLGVLLRYRNKDTEAVDVFSRSLQVEPNNIVLRLNLGNTLKSLGRTGEAREEFEKAGELARKALLRDPRDASARARLAFVQTQTGGRDGSLDNALQAATLAPSEYTVLFWVTMTLEALGKRELAEPILQKATKQQLKDLRRQPDLQAFFRDKRFAEKQ
jgi:tetratricopeptide (TPR) repeat protein